MKRLTHPGLLTPGAVRLFAGVLWAVSMTSSASGAETCEILIEAFRNQLTTLVSPTEGQPSPSIKLAMDTFEQGYNQCRSGQEEQGIATIRQAMALLAGSDQSGG